MQCSRLRVIAAAFAGIAVASVYLAPAPQADPASDEALRKRLETMLGVMKQARDRHVSRPEKGPMIEGAVQGMLARLDPETVFYTPAEFRDLRQTAARLTADAGVIVRREPATQRGAPRGLRIVASLDGTPSSRAGLRAEDVITYVNGQSAGDLPPDKLIANRLVGTPGETLEFWVERPKARQSFIVQVGMQPAELGTPAAQRLQGNVLLLTVSSLDKGTAASVQRLVSGHTIGKDAIAGVILDLRHVSRGPLAEALDLADAFLEAGTIVEVASRRTNAPLVHSAKLGDSLAGRPLVVLVNQGTARVGEVVAGALQSHRRALVVGAKTAGWGSAQTFVPVGRNGQRGMLHLTTERYVLSSGKAIDKAGISPDVVVPERSADTACRDTDAPDGTDAGLCERLSARNDPVVRAALGHFTGTASVAATRP